MQFKDAVVSVGPGGTSKFWLDGDTVVKMGSGFIRLLCCSSKVVVGGGSGSAGTAEYGQQHHQQVVHMIDADPECFSAMIHLARYGSVPASFLYDGKKQQLLTELADRCGVKNRLQRALAKDKRKLSRSQAAMTAPEEQQRTRDEEMKAVVQDVPTSEDGIECFLPLVGGGWKGEEDPERSASSLKLEPNVPAESNRRYIDNSVPSKIQGQERKGGGQQDRQQELSCVQCGNNRGLGESWSWIDLISTERSSPDRFSYCLKCEATIGQFRIHNQHNRAGMEGEEEPYFCRECSLCERCRGEEDEEREDSDCSMWIGNGLLQRLSEIRMNESTTINIITG